MKALWFRPTVRRAVLPVVVLLACGACRSVAPSDLAALSADPPSPYSIVVTGGAFVEASSGTEPLDRTFAVERTTPEALGLETIVESLRVARTFVRVARDERGLAERAAFAARRGPMRLTDDAARELLDQAAADGHDYLLVVERLVDGPVFEYGINGRWPITVAAWLIVGLGMVIPDHTFESRAELHVAIRDVHSGEVVYRRVFDADPVELSLVERGNLLGILISIIVPPFWVGNDDGSVLARVRGATRERLLFLLAQDLKSAGCRNELIAAAPAAIEIERVGERLHVKIAALEGVSLLRATLDGRPIENPAFAEFARELTGRPTYRAGAIDYEASMPVPAGGRFLQLLVQTVGGRVASTTVDLAASKAET